MFEFPSNSVEEAKQALLAAIVASSDDAIISKTLQGIITSWNPAAQRLFGYAEHEVLGQHISIIIPKDRLQEEDYIIGEIISGNKVEHFETVRETKNGTSIPVSLTISPILDRNGTIIGASKIGRDISERIAIQQEREQLFRKAQFLNQRKDKLMAMATHELKTPLTSLDGFLQILKQQTDVDDKNYFLIDRCLKQAGKLTALIDDLLDLSRLRDGKVQLTRTNFDLASLVSEIFEQYGNFAKHQLVLKTDGPAIVYADQVRIEQVLTNLITNAIKYSPDGGVVEVTIEEKDDAVYICVRDEGIGIDIEHLEVVFAQFYRVIDPKLKIPGFGLGLYISKEIIDRHGGTLVAESKKGVGSIFKVKLPK